MPTLTIGQASDVVTVLEAITGACRDRDRILDAALRLRTQAGTKLLVSPEHIIKGAPLDASVEMLVDSWVGWGDDPIFEEPLRSVVDIETHGRT
jgi:hypothetical protein